jgi:hypothetical protein
MKQINKFLTELDDYELAYFAKYRLPTFIPETQSEIKKYLVKKGLTDSKVEQLVSVNPKRQSKKGQQRCPRCSSDKIKTEKVEGTDNDNGIESVDKITATNNLNVKTICNVCGFCIPEPKIKKPKSYGRNLLDKVIKTIDGVISGAISGV